MSTISASSLFHFTRTRENLLSILRHTFWPNFCLERAPFQHEGSVPENGTPMVCFCDIPLSATANHMQRYGRYAIGLSKEWGIRNGISPVLYTHEESPVSAGLRALMTQGLQPGDGLTLSRLWEEWMRLMSFTKPYEGTTCVDGNAVPTVFYNEREWRWVPQQLPDRIRNGIDASEFVNGKPDPDLTQQLHQACALSFEPNDIRFIVVASEDEIVQTVQHILEIKTRFSYEEKTLLSTRLISADRIHADF